MISNNLHLFAIPVNSFLDSSPDGLHNINSAFLIRVLKFFQLPVKDSKNVLTGMINRCRLFEIIKSYTNSHGNVNIFWIPVFRRHHINHLMMKG